MPVSTSIPEACNIALVDFEIHGVEAEILRGIHRFSRRKNWNFHLADTPNLFEEVRVNRDILSGVIASVRTPERAEALRELDLPVVNIANVDPAGFGFPSVLPDEEAIARLALDHLLERGYREFAVSPLPFEYADRGSRERVLAFAREANLRGYSCSGLVFDESQSAGRETDELDGIRALRSLHDTQLALFAANQRLAERWMFLIRLPGEEIGRRAAAMLDRMMQGGVADGLDLVPPSGLDVRQSTHFIAVNTPLVAKAMMYIVEHAHENIGAADVVRAAATNRRKLERLFKARLNRTILEQIHQIRISRAKRMLEDGGMPIAEVAAACGFQTNHQLCRVFKRYGEPPPSRLRQRSTAD